MQDFVQSNLAQFAPLIVPGLVGLVMLRLLIELLFSLTRQGLARGAVVQRAWGRYITGLFFAGFFLSFLAPLLHVRLDTTPIWVLLVIGLILAAIHSSVLARASGTAQQPKPATQRPNTQQPNTQQFQAAVQAVKQAKEQAKAKADRPEDPENPHQAALLVLPDGRQLMIEQKANELSISKLPLPLAHQGQTDPLSSERAESWFERQGARLERTLQGQELAAAQLRLSTVKSMLLLGQIGIGEADADVKMVLQQVRRG